MNALGFLGLQFTALAIQWSLPDEQLAARIFAMVAVLAFSIAAIREIHRDNF